VRQCGKASARRPHRRVDAGDEEASGSDGRCGAEGRRAREHMRVEEVTNRRENMDGSGVS
jgi:hypothetical protein